MTHTTLSLKLIFSCSRQVLQTMIYPATAYSLGNKKNLFLPPSSTSNVFLLPQPMLWAAQNPSVIMNSYPCFSSTKSPSLSLRTCTFWLAPPSLTVMSSSSFLQTEHHSCFNMQQMNHEEVAGMARPKRFFGSSCKTRLSTPSELTTGNPTCNKFSALVLDINFCGLWGKSIELKEFLFQDLWLWVLFGGFSGRGNFFYIIGEVCSLFLPINTALLGEPFESFCLCICDFMLLSLLIFCMSFSRIWNASSFLISGLD